MDFSRAQDRLLSFAASAMLTSAVLATAPQTGLVTAASGPQPAQVMAAIEGARSAGFAGIKDTPAPAAVAAPAAVPAKSVSAKEAFPITEAQIQKLRKLATGSDGHPDTLVEPVSQALGLGPAKVYPTFSAEDPDTKIFVQIFVLPGSNGYVIGRRVGRGAIRYFRVDPGMKLISGVSQVDYKAPPVALTTEEATPLWKEDVTTWAGIADSLG